MKINETTNIFGAEDEIVLAPMANAASLGQDTASALQGTFAIQTQASPCDVFVNAIHLGEDSLTMYMGETCYISASVYPLNATNKSLAWLTDSSECVTVQNGVITAHAPGNTKIYAYSTDGSGACACCSVRVIPAVYVTGIVLTESAIAMHRGESRSLMASVHPSYASHKKIAWSSSNPRIASVNDNGVITAKASGTVYILASATDGSGEQACCYVAVMQTAKVSTEEAPPNKATESTFADPVDVYTGAHLLKINLMTLFGGQGLSLTAHYNSTDLTMGSLGRGWYHNYEKRLEFHGNEVRAYSSPSQFSTYALHDEYCTCLLCTNLAKRNYVLTQTHQGDYPYVIDCNAHHKEYYDAQGRLCKITDHQGFDTLISHTDNLCTITDTVSGKRIHLETDCSGTVTRIYDDDNRQVSLTYKDECLTVIEDVNGKRLSYAYDTDGRVLKGIDAEGICYFSNTYDDYGRVIQQKDAIEGHAASSFVYEGNTRITTNRNGKTSLREYDDNGLLTRYIDENGNTKTYEYDECYNITRETDGCGETVTKLYNSFNKPYKITDKNGFVTDLVYDENGNLISITYPSIDGSYTIEMFAYNARNQLTHHYDLRGTQTAYTYDENGMPLSKKVGTRDAILYSYRNGLLESQTDALGHTTDYIYNSLGQMIRKIDADHKNTYYAYDAMGNLLRVTDAEGGVTQYTYDGNYQKTSVTDARGNKTEYTYNGNMKNDSVLFPDGSKITYVFDGEDRPVTVKDRAGNVTTITYDDCGNVLSKRFADGACFSYEYDAMGRVIKETSPTGAVTLKNYDGIGNLLTVTDDDGNVTRYYYNALSKPIVYINASSYDTQYTYSPAGDLLSETDPLRNTKSYTYDAYGNCLSATDANGNVTTYTYDANNRLLTVTNALGQTTTNTYDVRGNLISTKDAKGYTVRYGYDALGRRTTVTDAKGNTFTTFYDACGNVVKTTDPEGNTVSETVYNELNLPAQVKNAAGKTTSYTYTPLGKVESVTDPLGEITEYFYDACGRNSSVLDASGHESRMQYDWLGNVTVLSGPLHGATQYGYDKRGRLISESTVSGGERKYGYNAMSVKNEITNAKGQKKRIFFDAAGRITGYTTPEDSVCYTYDACGNVLTVTDSHGTITRTYDALHRVTSYTDTYGKVIRYEYDAVGNLSRLIYPDNTAVSYEYDGNHNLTRVTDWAYRITVYEYDENNRATRVIKPDGSETNTVYDNKQRLVSTVERALHHGIISGFEYTYDDLSRVVEEKVLAKNIKMCYTYDELSRVTKRTVKNMSDVVLSEEAFTYDAASNVTAAPGCSFVYDVSNRLTSFNGSAVSYDLDGNMLSNGSLSCTYDSANRLISAGGHTYTYNAEDVRIRNLCNTEDTTYTYDTNCRLSKLLMKTTNGVVTKYVYGRGLIGEEVDNNPCLNVYHFDSRGSTVAITDMGCLTTDTFTYDTYGKLVSRTGTSKVIFGYNGRDGVVTDDNGLIYMRARYYSPDMKRFINADIVAGDISNAVTLNRFAYANGNPVSFVDPFGLSVDDRVQNPSNTPEAKPATRDEYITTYMKNTNNDLYKLLESWGFSLTDPIYESTEYIDLLCGGFTVNLNVSISFATPGDANVNSSISANSGYATHDATTPELKLPWGDIGTKVGVYLDEERLSVGASAAVRDGEWTFETRHQVGLYSEANITSVTYTPEDEYLPIVSISLDAEINHLAKLAVAAMAIAAAYTPQAIVAAAPSLANFINQLGAMTPTFAN